MNSEYLTSAAKADQIPNFERPHVAFIGRSNCGKSTLLNAICQRKNLARTSSTPGRTQMINFFELNGQTILADLPGYGFSQTGKRNRESWFPLMTSYLEHPELRLCLMLVDSRRKIDEDDLYLINWLQRNQNLMLALTKADKLKKNEARLLVQNMKKQLGATIGDDNVPEIVLVSSLKKQFIPELQELILSLAL